jgi:hypothetical protein
VNSRQTQSLFVHVRKKVRDGTAGALIKISREMSSNMRSKLAGLSTSHHFRRGISNCGETRQLPGVTGPWGKIAEVKPAGLARTGPARPGRQWNRSCFYFLVQLLIRFYATRSKSKRIPMSLSDSAASGGKYIQNTADICGASQTCRKEIPTHNNETWGGLVLGGGHDQLGRRRFQRVETARARTLRPL